MAFTEYWIQFRRDLSVFTRSAITPPRVNRFGRNVQHSEYIHCRGLALADFGRDPHSTDILTGSRFFLSGK